ncbi:hypothetical protein [Actinomadura alba]|uniref:hypothetical protein n=1 Tax=Actinomadura alba TaxID=406431 RepID=UPI0031DE9B9F
MTAQVTESAVGHAAAVAAAAAGTAGVRIEAARDPGRLHAVSELLGQVWGTSPAQSPLAPDVLRAIAHAGGIVHVAYGATGLVGAAAAIFGPPASRSLYSLAAAARRSDRGVGFALKQAQRAWSLGHGVTSIAWTFDPLVSRNARFNLVKLGAVAREYTVDFYGRLYDQVNRDDETDRLTVLWELTSHRATMAAQGLPLPDDAPQVLEAFLRAPDGGPLAVRDEHALWCRAPEDIVALRHRNPDQAARWRTAVRDVLVPAFAKGLVAVAMTRDGWYRLENP